MIIPVVLYHGLTPWSEPRIFDALLDVPASVRPAVAPYLIQFAYLLNDLSEISDDELRDGAMMTALAKLVAMCFKHARTREDFIKILIRWMDVVREVVRAPNGLSGLGYIHELGPGSGAVCAGWSIAMSRRTTCCSLGRAQSSSPTSVWPGCTRPVS